MHVSRHFVNEKGTGAQICPAVVSGILTGNAPVSCWPIFQFQKSLRKLTRPSFLLKRRMAGCFFFSGLLAIGITALHVLLVFFLAQIFQLLLFDRETHGLGTQLTI